MKKWEYYYESRRFENSNTEVTGFLNRKGEQGWELVCFDVVNYFFCFVFKREVQ
jgi:hypothetical protein